MKQPPIGKNCMSQFEINHGSPSVGIKIQERMQNSPDTSWKGFNVWASSHSRRDAGLIIEQIPPPRERIDLLDGKVNLTKEGLNTDQQTRSPTECAEVRDEKHVTANLQSRKPDAKKGFPGARRKDLCITRVPAASRTSAHIILQS